MEMDELLQWCKDELKSPDWQSHWYHPTYWRGVNQGVKVGLISVITKIEMEKKQ